MGNHEQFKKEVKAFQGLVYTIAFGILQSPEEALDIVQETFLKAHEEPGFLAPEFNRKSWLVKVARHLALNVKRSFLRGLKSLFRIQNWLERASQQSLEEFVLKNESHRELRTALEKLSDEDQEILTLRYAADLSYEEIAEQLEIKIGTVMSRLARAREKVGIALNKEMNHE